MTRIERFEEIEAWQAAWLLTRRIYALTNEGPFGRDFGLRDQMRRASVSIMSNIAEGFESRTPAMFIEFLGRAKASAGELRAQSYVALDVGYFDQSQFDETFEIADKCSRQISRFISYLQSQQKKVKTTFKRFNLITHMPKHRSKPDNETTFKRFNVLTF